MGIMTFLRNRAGIIMVGAIGFAIVAFLLGDVANYGGPLWGGNQNEVGNIDGKSVEYLEFNNQVDMAKANFQQQSGGNVSPQMTAYIVENLWNQQVSQVLLNKEVERIGLRIGQSELNDMITGQNPSQQLTPYFTNPQTGEFDRAQLNMFLSNIKNEPGDSPQKAQWEQLLTVIKDSRLQEKYNQLVENSVYVTSLEAQDDFTNRNKLANFSYVLLDYATIPDKDVQPTEADFKAYYNEHKNAFRSPQETRSIEYVVFEAIPTQADSAAARENIQNTLAEFKTTENDSLFAALKSETQYPLIYRNKGTLSPALDSAIFASSIGATVGPIYENGTYEIAKILDTRMSPDSVKASHILLNPATEGGIDKAQAKADSLKALVQNGRSFAELAAEFGTDGTKEKGGELGTFGRGAMIPAFETAVFNGKPGDVFVLTTQFGVHLIKINDQIGSSRVVKAAIVDHSIKSSSETLQAAFAKASDFFGKATGETFAQVAKEQGLELQNAEQVLPMQAQIAGIENPRDIVRWAYEAEQGDISDKIFELDNKSVVAHLTNITPKGIAPLADIKEEIKPEVIKQIKAAKLAEKLNGAVKGQTDLNQVAKQLSTTAHAVDNVVFANPIVPGVAMEGNVVGTVFGLQPNKMSQAIEGVQGVYAVHVKDFVNPEVPKDLSNQKRQIKQGLTQRIPSAIFQTLQDKAKISDNRVKFY